VGRISWRHPNLPQPFYGSGSSAMTIIRNAKFRILPPQACSAIHVGSWVAFSSRRRREPGQWLWDDAYGAVARTHCGMSESRRPTTSC
jgi:hypothetical protein